MGKRKSKSKKAWKKIGDDQQSFKEDTSVDTENRNFIYDEVDEFHNRNDEDIRKTLQQQREGNETKLEQVMGIGGNSDSEDEDSDLDDNFDEDLVDDDVLEEVEEQEQQERAWGANKKNFFGTDLKDERFNKVAASYGTEQAERLEVELGSVKKLQESMQEQLVENVFDDFMVSAESTRSEGTGQDADKKDNNEELVIGSPHIKTFINELKEINHQLKTKIAPLYKAMKENYQFSDAVREYLKLAYNGSLNYIATVSSYLLLYKEGPLPLPKNHSIFSMLAQYKHIMQTLESYDERLKSCLEDLLQKLTEGSLPKSVLEKPVGEITNPQPMTSESPKKKKRSKKKTKAVSYSLLDGYVDTDSDSEVEHAAKRKKVHFADDLVDVQEESEPGPELEEEEEDPDKRRVITDEIKKNRGLTPLRNRDQKNPRVRYRNKYQSKLKKRKGQVQPMRTEMKKYDGERTGISTHIVRSIKLK